MKEGAKVVFCGRGEEKGNAIAAATGAVFVKADVSVESQVKHVIDTAVAQFGQLDCLFNNAGGAYSGPGMPSVLTSSEEMIRQSFGLNFESVVWGIKHATPHLKKQQTSAIINNSSVAAKRPGFGDALYSAAKGAVDSYGRLAAMELARDGVRVNGISPGATATPIFWGGSPGSARGSKLTEEDNRVRMAKVEANILKNVVSLRIGRAGTGVDVAQLALFLASDASAWITGQDITVDGGMSGFDAPNKGWMADTPARDPVPYRKRGSKL